MIKQGKDKFYDEVVKEPSKDKFRKFIKENLGELDEVDFKEQWIPKGELSKLLLAMANSRGGVIVVGIKENDDGTLEIASSHMGDLENMQNTEHIQKNLREQYMKTLQVAKVTYLTCQKAYNAYTDEASRSSVCLLFF